MEIHKPHAAGSWREFLIEIGTIVTGIVIALALEEGVRALHDRQVAAEAREAIYAEIRENLQYLRGREATQPCVGRRLDEIGDLLSKAGEGPLAKRPSWIGQPSIWFTTSQRWQVATSSGRASLFSNAEQGAISSVYVLDSLMAEQQQKEQAAWAQLRALEGWTGPLGSVGRAQFVAALQQARYAHWQTDVIIRLAQQRAAVLGIKDVLAHSMGDYDIPHAVCLPIDTSRTAALKRLSADNPFSQPK